jgi:hypothetical protein
LTVDVVFGAGSYFGAFKIPQFCYGLQIYEEVVSVYDKLLTYPIGSKLVEVRRQRNVLGRKHDSVFYHRLIHRSAHPREIDIGYRYLESDLQNDLRRLIQSSASLFFFKLS